MTPKQQAKKKEFKKLERLYKRIEPVGSRVTCNPPPTDTDEDYLVLLKSDDGWDEFCDMMDKEKWEFDGSDIDDAADTREEWDRFQSFSKNGINLIVTSSELFFRRFMAASSVAKRLNLMNKCDRIALFQAVLYGNEPMPELMEAA